MKLVTVCAWCPDNRTKTAAAIAEGNQVSHTMCLSCQGKMAEQEREYRASRCVAKFGRFGVDRLGRILKIS